MYAYGKMSKALYYYSSVLKNTIQENFDFELSFWIDTLEKNEAFQNYLQNDVNSLSILSVSELISYVRGREAEYKGDYDAALGYYMESINYYDAGDRYENLTRNLYESKYEQARKLLEQNDLVSAYHLFAEISAYDDSAQYMQFIAQSLGYDPQQGTPTPTNIPQTPRPVNTSTPRPVNTAVAAQNISLEVKAYKGYNMLSWNSISGTASYTIRRQ